jgi:O-antigen ligase
MFLRKPDLSLIPGFAVAAIIAGLFTSRAMSSMGMIILAIYAVFFSDFKKNFSVFINDRVLIFLTLIFFIYLLSAINSTEDRAFLEERIRMKLPFLFLPFAFSVFRDHINLRQFQLLIFLFMLLAVATSATVTYDFFKQYQQVVNSYDHGATVETPFSHVRYSLMIAFGVICSVYLFLKKFHLKYPWERWLILAATVYLISFQHLLAVRSGILALYLCTVWFLFYQIFKKKNLKLGFIFAVAILLAPFAAYLIFPSIQMKVSYMQTDLNELFVKGNASYSDGGRILSIEKGLELFSEHPLTGVGIGDLRVEMKNKLSNLPENPNDVLLPHNQFVYVAAGTGIFGILVFIIAVMLPLFNRKLFRSPLFACFNIILISSFLTEPTIEEQIGSAFYLSILLLLYMWYQYHAPEESKN